MKNTIIIFLFFNAFQVFAQVQVPIVSKEWSFVEREPRRFENKLGNEAVYLNGQASLENVKFQDGIIEFDFMAEKPRAFAGLYFRAQDRGNHETFYVRLHKSGFPDAIQYNPEFNGESNWQLYREHQAVINFNPKEWNHIKVEFRGSELKAFLNGMPEPILHVANLRRKDKKGFIGFYSFLGAYFSNFKYTQFSETTPFNQHEKYDPDVVREWELSKTYEISKMDVNQYPKTKKLEWKIYSAEPSGLLNINKHRRKTSSGNFEENPVNVVWARYKFRSSEPAVKKLSFDFSDDAVVYFNGAKLFQGKNSFRAKGPTFRGDMLIDGNTLFLNTKKGENEILVAVSDKANGWGIMAKIE
ncbi:family 16 glycoside hydrolase [Maribacter algicola]|uniref:Family 16 glycoside hydrolase n=1 Tax=Meishania litoralis TaxID=3434685 RepID=A0ACC7LJ98_9FLAO